jgi:hypothetical protein
MFLASDSNRAVFAFDSNPKVQNKRVSVSIGADVSADIELNRDDKAEQLYLTISLPGQPSQMLRDINLDGVWDVKYMLQTNDPFIFFNKQWLRVDKIVGSRPNIEALSGNTSYVFDMKSGQWIPKLVNSTRQP